MKSRTSICRTSQNEEIARYSFLFTHKQPFSSSIYLNQCMHKLETPCRKRPHAHVWDAPENYSRPYPSSGSIDQEGMDPSRGAQNFVSASDRINHARGDLSNCSYQDANGLSGGGNETEGCNTSSGFAASTSNKLEEVSPSCGNVFEALGRWSDAIKLMSSNLDRCNHCFFWSSEE